MNRYTVKIIYWNRHAFSDQGRHYNPGQYVDADVTVLQAKITEEQAKTQANQLWKGLSPKDWKKQIELFTPSGEAIFKHLQL